MATTKISQQQVLGIDFASDAEVALAVSDTMNNHIATLPHIDVVPATKTIEGVVTVGDGLDVANGLISVNRNLGSAYGWKDNVVLFSNPGGADPQKNPLWADCGNGIWGLLFSNTNINRAFADLHVNHDYLVNSPIYPHVHWFPLSYSTGNVCWLIEYVIAKGHSQSESLTTTASSFKIVGTAKGLIGEHIVSECSDLQAFAVSEPDTVVRVKVSRLPEDPLDTFYGSVVGLMMDFHYQSDRETTINKAPNFYGVI